MDKYHSHDCFKKLVVLLNFCFTTYLPGLVRWYWDFIHLFLKQNFSTVNMPILGIQYTQIWVIKTYKWKPDKIFGYWESTYGLNVVGQTIRLFDLVSNPYPAFLSLGIDEILQSERIDDRSTPRLIVFVQPRQLAESLSNWINEKSATDSKPYNSSRFVSQNVTGDTAGQKIIHTR